MIGAIGQQTLINASAVNRGLAMRNGDIHNIEKNISAERYDVVNITPTGRVMSLIETLMNTKERLKETKEGLLNGASSNEGMGAVIDEQISNLNDIIKGIDEQIEELMKQESEQAVEEAKEKQETKQPLTKAEADSKHLTNIAFATNDIKQAEIIDATKDRLRGRANVVKAELASDGSDALDSKRDELSELMSRIETASVMVVEKNGEITEAVTEEQEVTANPVVLAPPDKEFIEQWVEEQQKATEVKEPQSEISNFESL